MAGLEELGYAFALVRVVLQGDDNMASVTSRMKRIATKLRNRVVLRHSNYIFHNLENYDNLAIYPDYRMIYNRIKKAGNTTILAFLNEAFFGGSFADARDLKRKLIRPSDLRPSELRALRKYYSFTFVRNPYDRVLSAYLGALDRKRGDSVRVRNSLRRFYFDREGREHFHEFLKFLDSGGLYSDRHWWPQTDLLFQPAEAFSFIGKLENLVADMRVVLCAAGINADLSSRLDKPHEVERRAGNKIRSAKTKAEQYYTPHAREIVDRLYRKDFELFGYPIASHQ